MRKHPKKKRRVERDGKFTPIPRKVRLAAHKESCEVCGLKYGSLFVGRDAKGKLGPMRIKEAIHHLFPRRFLERKKLNPHLAINLLSCCGSCHGQQAEAENAFFRGDNVTWLSWIMAHGWPVQRIIEASKFYGLGFESMPMLGNV